MFRTSFPSVGGLTTYVRLFDDKLQICRLEITRNAGSSEGLNTWQEYQDQGNRLIADANRIVAAMNSAPDANRIIRHLAAYGAHASSIRLSDDQAMADAIRAYLAKVGNEL